MRFYKIQVNSANVLRGDWRDGWHQLDLPEWLADADKVDYQLAIESFTMNLPAAAPGTPYFLESTSITQGNTYSYYSTLTRAQLRLPAPHNCRQHL